MKAAGTLALYVAALFAMADGAFAQQTAPPAQAQPPNAEIRKAMTWKRFDYACAGNAKVTVFLRDQAAKVIYNERMYLMKQTVSADGNRYSDGRFVWWGKGNAGFIQEDKPDGNGAMLAKDCKLTEPEKKDPGVISGTVTYLQRMALPATAVIEVKLQDVSRADAPATVIAQQKIKAQGKQVPFPFELRFDPARIDPKHRYTVSARIMVGDELRFVSDQAHPVLTEGTIPSGIEILVKPVPQQ